jgi:hypothetical protein
VQVNDGVGHLVELLVGHGQPRDLHGQQGVAPHQPGRHGAHPALQIQGGRQGVLLVRLEVRQKRVGP